MSSDEAEKAFNKIKSKFETTIKAKDGKLVMKHNKPITKGQLAIFESYTKEEIEQLVFSKGFTSYQF